MWFIEDLRRLQQERQAIERLEMDSDWLRGTDWLLVGAHLCVDADLEAHGHIYEVRLRYPELFPEVPPAVIPRTGSERWSSHQYGDGGTLCLEWGPDNWHVGVTGAAMLESAHKLLLGENPRGGEPKFSLPSRHQLSAGQRLRQQPGRFYAGRSIIRACREAPIGVTGSAEVAVIFHKSSLVAFISSFAEAGDQPTIEATLPQALHEDPLLRMAKYPAAFSKAPLSGDEVSAVRSQAHLRELVCAGQSGDAGFAAWKGMSNSSSDTFAVLVADRDGELHLFIVVDPTQPEVWQLVRLPDDPEESHRLPVEAEQLTTKRVGIVGLGSLGSKIALSLARCGVHRFVFADDDIYLPGNSVRNALDWRAVGEHKVDATAEALALLCTQVEVDLRRVKLTGQESPTLVNGTLTQLAACDIVIDATADPSAFNILAALARRHEKPLVWAEVYAGGIGGSVARFRPGKDPNPQLMRGAYLAYAAQQTEPIPVVVTSYAAEAGHERPVASDADVSVIAAHATRLATDTVLGVEPSDYPYSMYLIGTQRGWVFSAPFEAVPIRTDHLAHEQEPKSAGPEVIQEAGTFLMGLVEKIRR